MLDAYLAFANEVNQAIEEADDPEDLDWQSIIRATVVEPMPLYCYAGVQEWIIEGIRWRSRHLVAWCMNVLAEYCRPCHPCRCAELGTPSTS